MIWVVFAFMTALCESAKDVFSKRGLRIADVYVLTLAWAFFTLLFQLPLLAFIKIPMLDLRFWMFLVLAGTLNLAANLLYIKAIKSSDLSITVPIITFTPLFLILTSPLILREYPTFYSIIGIFLIVGGSYVLNLGEMKNNFFAPIQALVRNKGPRMMLFVALIWSVSANLDKMGVQMSTPLFWPIAMNAFITIVMTPVVFLGSKVEGEQLHKILKNFLAIGFCKTIGISCQMLAINLTLVAYVISIKRLSAVMTVLFGYLIFKERGIRERLMGAVIMVGGVLIITLSQIK